MIGVLHSCLIFSTVFFFIRTADNCITRAAVAACAACRVAATPVCMQVTMERHFAALSPRRCNGPVAAHGRALPLGPDGAVEPPARRGEAGAEWDSHSGSAMVTRPASASRASPRSGTERTGDTVFGGSNGRSAGRMAEPRRANRRWPMRHTRIRAHADRPPPVRSPLDPA